MITAKRGDFVCIELEHVAVFQDSSIGRQVTHSVLCGTVWNVTRDGIAKTVRTPDGHISNIEKMTGYECHYIVGAAMLDVPKALVAAQGKTSSEEVREALRPLLFKPLTLVEKKVKP